MIQMTECKKKENEWIETATELTIELIERNIMVFLNFF